MIAQLYDNAYDVRIFDLTQLAWKQGLMDCFTHAGNPPIDRNEADLALARCGLRRTTPWKRLRHAHLDQASVKFHRPTKKKKQTKPKQT
jgi:hypothetical protein